VSDRMGPTPDPGYGLYSAAQSGSPQGSQTDVTGNHGADLGYRHDATVGTHTHAHIAFDGPQLAEDDGSHVHPHFHDGSEDHHRHDHSGLVWLDTDAGGPGQAVSSSGRRPVVGHDDRQWTPRSRAAFFERDSLTDQPEHAFTGDLNSRLGQAEEALGEADERWRTAHEMAGEARTRADALPTRSNVAEARELEAAEHVLASRRNALQSQVSRMLAEWQDFSDGFAIGRTGRTGGMAEVLYRAQFPHSEPTLGDYERDHGPRSR
jgi:hypothetical protein